MNHVRSFRRLLLLLLSLTLSVQAMAVASLGACHQAKPFASTRMKVAVTHGHHGDVSAHHAAKHDDGKHGAVTAHSGDSQDRSTQDDGSRVKCAACAACHLCSVVLLTDTALAYFPTSESASFAESTVPRVRNVASSLERPPRA